MSSTESPALEGTRILDLSRHLPGPMATMFLADMGAEVIKLEDPAVGDPLRYIPPLVDGTSAMFLSINRSKRSVSINLKTSRGKDLALRLAATCDVVVEGFRPGVMKKLGLGFDDLKAVRRDIILCSITGYGQNGPDRDTPGHDINYCARAGILSQSGEPDLGPQICGAQVADVAGGVWPAVSAIIAALFQRLHTGKGQWIDIALADGALSTMALSLAPVLAKSPTVPRGMGPLNGGLACYGVYQTADGGHLAVGALEEPFFDALCNAMDLPGLRGQGMATGRQGMKVRQQLADKFRTMTRDQWTEKLKGVDCCVEPVLDLHEVPTHPQFQARQMFVQQNQPKGLRTHFASPIKLANNPPLDLHTPSLGEHTEEILQGLGLDSDTLGSLAEKGIIRLGEHNS